MSKQPKLDKAYDGRGSNMGRRNVLPDDPAQSVRLHLARLDMSGDYDNGGAYWGNGCPSPMWIAWNADGVLVFTRNATREKAQYEVLRLIPGATFYR